jgi:hypothetical protein
VVGGVRYSRLVTLVASLRLMSLNSRKMAPIESARTDHSSAPANCGVQWTLLSAGLKSSSTIASGSSSSALAVNWIRVPVRRSKRGQKRFWYRVPLVIDSSASRHRPMAAGGKPARLIRAATTRATPPSPSSRPTHWRRLTRSPTRGAAKAVRMGCMPTIRADSPAGMPSLIALQTPPR